MKLKLMNMNWYNVDSTPLSEDDLADTITELNDVAAKWRSIGVLLGIRDSQLEAIQLQGDSPLDCLRQMLASWLRKNYSVERFGDPTWAKLVEAINHSAGGGNPHLACTIAKKHGGIDLTQSPRRRKSDRESRERQIEELQLENKKLQQLKEEHEGQIRDLQQQLHKAWQQVDGKPVSPEKCYATGKGLEVAVVGEHNKAVLHAVDEEGREFDKSPENIQCEFKSETNDIEVSCKVEKKYEISYKPTHSGIHQLSIRVEETHIRGSPFTVLVKLPIQRPGTPVKIIENITNPWGLALRHNGEIIVAELRNRCVSIFAPNGEKIRTFGTQGSAHGQFKYPRGIAFDSAGNILVAEGGNHRIQKFTAEGQFLIAVGRKGSGHLEFDDPIGIVINHKNKKVYICDCDNHRIQILNEDLTFSAIFGSYGSGDGQFNYPWDVALDSTGCTYIADNENHCIQVFTPEGMFLRRFGKKGSGEGELHSPSSITIDSDDLVYITEVNNNRVSVFTCEGKFVQFFGTNREGMVLFYKPCGIAVDKSGLVYVSDTNDRLLAF